MHVVRKKNLVEPELSYQIVGTLFSVSNELGSGLLERYYQKAIAVAFRKNRIPYEEQVHVPLTFSGETVGRYFIDFVIDNKIILEIKRGQHVNRTHMIQTYSYCKALELPLAILAYFGTDGVQYKRVINQEKL